MCSLVENVYGCPIRRLQDNSTIGKIVLYLYHTLQRCYQQTFSILPQCLTCVLLEHISTRHLKEMGITITHTGYFYSLSIHSFLAACWKRAPPFEYPHTLELQPGIHVSTAPNTSRSKSTLLQKGEH